METAGFYGEFEDVGVVEEERKGFSCILMWYGVCKEGWRGVLAIGFREGVFM